MSPGDKDCTGIRMRRKVLFMNTQVDPSHVHIIRLTLEIALKVGERHLRFIEIDHTSQQNMKYTRSIAVSVFAQSGDTASFTTHEAVLAAHSALQ
jgi:hypothetical protein